ncbi:hypothetical protein CMI47_00835 [Candidatus Pacearchaeota archaeon]|nr:hypothetical protein [Candidatus Pacearchaeota archaeon]
MGKTDETPDHMGLLGSKESSHQNGRGSVYSLREFAQLIGRSVSTLKSWDRKKILVAKRYPSGQRFYTEDQLTTILEGRQSAD